MYVLYYRLGGWMGGWKQRSGRLSVALLLRLHDGDDDDDDEVDVCILRSLNGYTVT